MPAHRTEFFKFFVKIQMCPWIGILYDFTPICSSHSQLLLNTRMYKVGTWQIHIDPTHKTVMKLACSGIGLCVGTMGVNAC